MSLFQKLLDTSNTNTYRRDNSPNFYRRPNSTLAKESDSEDEEEEASPPPSRIVREKKAKKPRRRKKTTQFLANVSGTRYEIIRETVEKYGFGIAKDDDFVNCFLIWCDNFVSTERVAELKSFQRINHFPGMSEICRKDLLARNMAKMMKSHADEYNFVPRTWVMPHEQTHFHNYLRDLKKNNKKKTFIIKPSNGAMGNGIRLMKCSDPLPQGENLILQEYIDKPFLVDGYKCDMRIYVLVTNCDPLRVFLYNDGLLRMSTERYVHPNEDNMEALFMHLTNYSVNKHNDKYQKSDDETKGSKRSLRFLNEYLRRHHYDIQTLWKNIIELIIKTMVVAAPHLLHNYRMCRPGQSARVSSSVCFEILGFDILLDRKLRPWLLEVNRSPSFGCDEKVDRDVKYQLLADSLRLVNIKVSDKRRDLAEQKARTQRRLLQSSQIGKIDYNGNVDLMKRQKSVIRRKETLQDLLQRVRREQAQEEFENRNGGRFRRIFPQEDRERHEKYVKLLMSSFQIFLSANNIIHKELEVTYDPKLDEHEVMEMLAACEAEASNIGLCVAGRDRAGDTETDKPPRSAPASLSRPRRLPDGEGSSRSASCVRDSGRTKRRLNAVLLPHVDGADVDPEPSVKALRLLNELSIKFPGKSEEDTELVLHELNERWLQHKQNVAKYWLVKLDSSKRRKVIDIVSSNVNSVLQRAFCVSELRGVRLKRIVDRVFNRLLWSNGQGLWECFSSTGSWETIFCKSTEQISTPELACCRRIVQLCKDCLLIVYQFAVETTAPATDSRRRQPFTEMVVDSNMNTTRPQTVPDLHVFRRSRSLDKS